jgi:hypothetical protein
VAGVSVLIGFGEAEGVVNGGTSPSLEVVTGPGAGMGAGSQRAPEEPVEQAIVGSLCLVRF